MAAAEHWGDTDAAAWKNTSAAVWKSRHILTIAADGIVHSDTPDPLLTYLCEATDGIVFGETTGLVLGLTLNEGVVFGESTGLILFFGVEDGIVHGDHTFYIRPTSEHDIFSKAFFEKFDFTVFENPELLALDNFDIKPIAFTSNAIPILNAFSVLKKTYNTEATDA